MKAIIDSYRTKVTVIQTVATLRAKATPWDAPTDRRAWQELELNLIKSGDCSIAPPTAAPFSSYFGITTLKSSSSCNLKCES